MPTPMPERWLLQMPNIRVGASDRRVYLYVDYHTPRKKWVTVSMTIKNNERRTAIEALCAMLSRDDETKAAHALRLLLKQLGVRHSRMESALRQREHGWEQL